MPSGSEAEAHRYGRSVLLRAWPLVWGASVTPTAAELQIVGAVAFHESGYGRGTYTNRTTNEKITGTNNWGAVTYPKGKPGACGPEGFTASDYNPTTGKWYETCFRRYATPEEGAAHTVRLTTKDRPESHRAMRAGDIDSFSRDMRRTAYYLSPYRDPERAADWHAAIVEKHVQAIAAALGEQVAARRGGGGSREPVDDRTSTRAGLGALLLLAIGTGAVLLGRKGRR